MLSLQSKDKEACKFWAK